MAEEKKLDLPETYSINDVEIMAEGTWKGDEYNGKDLEEMVTTFNETKDKLKPYVKLGHTEKQKLIQIDGLPAVGWIDNLKKVGTKLLADISNVPKKIYELIKAGAYKRVSSEIFQNIEINKKKYKYALKAIAFLGANTPAVESLNDIMALYNKEPDIIFTENSDIKTVDMESEKEQNKKQEELKMAELDDLKKSNDEMAVQLKQKDEEIKGLSQKLGEAEKSGESMKVRVTELENKSLKKEIEIKVDELISNKKLMPSQKEGMITLLYAVKQGEVKKFKIGDKEKSMDEILVDVISSYEVNVNTEIKSEFGKSNSEDDERNNLAQLALDLSKKDGISIKEATIRVSKTIQKG